MAKLVAYALVVLGIAFFLVGCGLLYSQVIRGRKQTGAEILSSDVEAFQQSDEGQVVTLYRSKYRIRYRVEGRTYEAPLRSTVGTSKASAVEEKLRNNPVGSQRPIYFLPAKPEDIVSNPLPRRLGFAMIFVSVGLAVFAAGALLLFQAQPLDW